VITLRATLPPPYNPVVLPAVDADSRYHSDTVDTILNTVYLLFLYHCSQIVRSRVCRSQPHNFTACRTAPLNYPYHYGSPFALVVVVLYADYVHRYRSDLFSTYLPPVTVPVLPTLTLPDFEFDSGDHIILQIWLPAAHAVRTHATPAPLAAFLEVTLHGPRARGATRRTRFNARADTTPCPRLQCHLYTDYLLPAL